MFPTGSVWAGVSIIGLQIPTLRHSHENAGTPKDYPHLLGGRIVGHQRPTPQLLRCRCSIETKQCLNCCSGCGSNLSRVSPPWRGCSKIYLMPRRRDGDPTSSGRFCKRFADCPALGPPGKGLPVTPLGTSRALWVGVTDYGVGCSPTTVPAGGGPRAAPRILEQDRAE